MTTCSKAFSATTAEQPLAPPLSPPPCGSTRVAHAVRAHPADDAHGHVSFRRDSYLTCNPCTPPVVESPHPALADQLAARVMASIRARLRARPYGTVAVAQQVLVTSCTAQSVGSANVAQSLWIGGGMLHV